jgi:hypothetical protein
MCNMPIDYQSDTPWEALICSPQSQNGGVSQWTYVCNSVGLCSIFYRGCE